MRQVVDASASLAYLPGGPGGELAGNAEGPLYLSVVHPAEVLTRSIDRCLATEDVLHALAVLPIAHVDVARGDAGRAAALRRASGRYGPSLGDRACRALAQRLVLPMLTADRAQAEIDRRLDLRLIR